jgi:carbon starvation protein CstA
MTFFGGTGGLQEALAAGGPAGVVNEISSSLLGTFGGILAILGVIILPITTGDTALRSSRMMLAESLSSFMKTDGRWKVVITTLPVALPTLYLATIDYSFLWRYVGWTNQVTAAVMLWTATMYLLKNKKFHWICGVPALFMTGVVSTYIFYAPEGFQMDYQLSMIIGSVITLAIAVWYVYQIIKHRQLGKNSTSLTAA